MKNINWRYTLGEILIVIIGITIAFAIDNYAESSKNSTLRQQYLESLLMDLRDDETVLKANADSIQRKIELASEIIPILNSDAPNKMAYADKIFSFIPLIEFQPSDNTYNTLINSGDFRLIQKFNLKKEIEQHYAAYKSLEKDYGRIENIQRTYVGDYFINTMDYDAFGRGEFGFNDERLLKNIILSMRGAYTLQLKSTQRVAKSCAELIKILEAEQN